MKTWSAGILMTFAASAAMAEGADLFELSLEELVQLPITIAAFTPQRTIDAPGTVYVISREDIRRYGWRDLKEILAAIPNLDYFWHWHWLPGGQRGFTGNFAGTLLLIDGHEVQNLLANETFIVNDFPSHTIERVEVLQGPNSTLYGGNAAQGVINVVTRIEAGPEELGDAEFIAGEADTRQFAFNAKRRYGELVLGLAGSAFGSDQDWRELREFAVDTERFSRDPKRDALRNLDPDHYVNRETNRTLNGRLRYGDWYAGVNYRSFTSDKGMEKARTDFGGGDLARRAYTQWFAGRNFAFESGINGFVEAVRLRELNRKWAQINLNRAARTYDEVVSAVEYSEILPSTRTTLKTRWNYSFDAQRSLIAGYDGWRQKMGDSVVLRDRGDGVFQYERTAGWRADKSSSEVNAAFVQYSQQWNPWDDERTLTLVAGLRHHSQSYTNNALLPRVGLVFKPDPDQAFKLTYGEAFRPPTSLEFEGTNDESIESQEMLMWELNHSLQRPLWGGLINHSAALYEMTAVNFYERIFIPGESGSIGRWLTQVSGEHRVRGIEELVQWQGGDWLVSLGGRYLDPDKAEFMGRDYIADVPRLKLKAGIAYQGFAKTSLALFADHWSTTYTLANNVDNTGKEILAVPAWTTLSLNARFGPYAIGDARLHWAVYAENLTDRTYYHANARGTSPIQFQQAPRNFRLQLVVDF
ncbi:MAG: TonB-dependent receptor [Gammaproteobacteria bacterium]|nr:TonB-dependent receptor [Gammaproteobacteria bacterium]